MKATYTKLKDGKWGARVVGTARELDFLESGGALMVHRKDGTVHSEVIGKITWRGKDYRSNEALAFVTFNRRA